MWYYAENSEQRGPVTKEELVAKLHAGELTLDTLVWTNNMRNWEKACEAEDLKEFLVDMPTASDADASSAFPQPETQGLQTLRVEDAETAKEDASSAEESNPLRLRPSGAGTLTVNHDKTAAVGVLRCEVCHREIAPSEALDYQGTTICQNCIPRAQNNLNEQHVANCVEYQAASILVRFAAYLIDSLILGMVFAAIKYGTSFASSDEMLGLENPSGWIAIVVLCTIYDTLFNCMFGATLGKRLLGLKVLHDGERLSFGRSFGRAIAKVFSALLCNYIYFIAVFTENKKALHDMISDSIVVTTR